MLSWSHVIISAAGECSPASCPPTPETLPSSQARSLAPAPSDPLALVQDLDSSSAPMASFSVFVLEQGSGPVERALDCEAVCTWSPVWLLYLCIAFGILFVVMLVINLFLCSAMSCACSRSSKEKEAASYLEPDFDSYARSWQGSQYGSR